MIHFFPEPHPDELFYSIIFRYHKLSGNLKHEYTYRKLFGCKVLNCFKYPSRLSNLCEQFEQNYIYDANSFIENNTFLPFFESFLGKTKASYYRNCILAGDKSPFAFAFNRVSGYLHNLDEIKFCPECVAEDRRLYYQAYIHRTHQIPGYYVCTIHNIPLKSILVESERFFNLDFDLDKFVKNDSIINNDEYIKNYFDHFNSISLDIAAIMVNSNNKVTEEQITDVYRKRLYKLGYLKGMSLINQKKLYESFSKYYPDKFLSLLGNPVDYENIENWLRKICLSNPKYRVNDPLRHLLFVRFLFGSAQNFVESLNKIDQVGLPFGTGPWPCLNPVSEHYHQDVVYNCRITRGRKAGEVEGKFSCSCGFEYYRKGPEKDMEERYTRSQIANFGHIWEERLKELIATKKYPLCSLAKVFGCDVKTILKYAHKFNLSECFNSNIKVDTNIKKIVEGINEERNKQYIREIEEFISNTPNVTRSMIYESLSKQVVWLRIYSKNDYKRIINSIDKVRKRSNFPVTTDWESKDNIINDAVKEIIDYILENKVYNRITENYILCKIQYKCVYKYLNTKFPKTRQTIEVYQETVEDFSFRKMQYAKMHFEETGIKPSKTEFRRFSKIYDWHLEGIKQQFDEVYNSIKVN